MAVSFGECLIRSPLLYAPVTDSTGSAHSASSYFTELTLALTTYRRIRFASYGDNRDDNLFKLEKPWSSQRS